MFGVIVTKRMALSFVAMLVAMLYTLGAGTAAWGHASLTGVDPQPGATLDAVPQEIVFTFNEALKEPGFAAVSLDGQELEGWTSKLDGARLIVIPPADSTQAGGEYVISFRVVSADGHPIKGSTDFAVSASDSSPEPEQSAAGNAQDKPQASESDADETDGGPGGIRSLLTAPWAWGGIVMVSAIAIAALVRNRTSKRNDETPQ